MREREHEHLFEYYPEPEVGRSLLRTVVHDQIAFDPRVLPKNAGKKINDIDEEFSFGSTLSSLNRYSSRLRVPLGELNGRIGRPSEIEQTVLLTLLPPKGFLFSRTYIFHYRGPEFGYSSGLFQHLGITFPFGNAPVEKIYLTRDVTDQMGDLCNAEIQLKKKEESEINKLLGLSADASTMLTLLPGHILVTKGLFVIAELTEGNLQRLSMNSRFDESEDEIVAKVTFGRHAFVLRLGKKPKPDYPRLMFNFPGEPCLDMVTSGDVEQERFDVSLN